MNSRLLAGGLLCLVSLVSEVTGGGATYSFLDDGLIVFDPSNTGGYWVLSIKDVWIVVTVGTMWLLQRRETESRFEEVWGDRYNLVREFIT